MGFLFGVIKTVLKLESDEGYTTLYQKPQYYTLQNGYNGDFFSCEFHPEKKLKSLCCSLKKLVSVGVCHH